MEQRLYQNWVFTLNHPDSHPPLPQAWDKSLIKFLVCQREVGKEGTLHYQGYVEFNARKRLTTLKKLNPAVHWEPRKGSRMQAIKYACKTDTREEGTEPIWYPEAIDVNTPSCDTKKSKYADLKESLDQGSDMSTIAQEHFALWLRHHKSLEEYRQLRVTPRNHNTEVIAIFGTTGTGKSQFCRDNFPNAYWKSRGDWWDGYRNHEVVIIDEFYGWLPLDFMLRLLDRYPFKVPVKGTFCEFTAKLIIITSNRGPGEWYKKESPEFMRRIDHIWSKTDLDEPFYVLKGLAPEQIVQKYCSVPIEPTTEEPIESGQITLSQVLNGLDDNLFSSNLLDE